MFYRIFKTFGIMLRFLILISSYKKCSQLLPPICSRRLGDQVLSAAVLQVQHSVGIASRSTHQTPSRRIARTMPRLGQRIDPQLLSTAVLQKRLAAQHTPRATEQGPTHRYLCALPRRRQPVNGIDGQLHVQRQQHVSVHLARNDRPEWFPAAVDGRRQRGVG